MRFFHSREFARAGQEQGIQRQSTQVDQPQTNGKPEQFIQSALFEWVYAWT
jgi:hypothetical protein